MSNLIQVLIEKFQPYKRAALILTLVIFFAIASYFLYFRVIKPQLVSTEKGYDDIANRDKNLGNTCEIMFFYADWCPHCKRTKPEWDAFVEEYNGKKIKKYKIFTHPIDCTDDENEESTKLITKYKVEGFPTVKFLIDDKEIEFSGKITKENLEAFVNQLGGTP